MGVATSVVGLAGSAFNMFSANQQKNAAQEAIDNYERQELDNAYENLQVSTLGADLATEQAAVQQANAVQALQGAGTRGLAQIGQLQAASNTLSREIGADLDRQQKEIDRMAAQDDARIRDMQESREQQELAGYGSQLNAANQKQAQALNSGIASIGTGIASVQGNKPAGSTNLAPRQTQVTGPTLQSAGVQNPQLQSVVPQLTGMTGMMGNNNLNFNGV